MKKRYPPNYLRTIRLSAALSQRELGSLLGVSQETISKYERRIRLPNEKRMFALEIIFGRRANAIFSWHYASIEEWVITNAAKLDYLTHGKLDNAARKKQELLKSMIERAGVNPSLYDNKLS